jgi:hypothetical protein
MRKQLHDPRHARLVANPGAPDNENRSENRLENHLENRLENRLKNHPKIVTAGLLRPRPA